MMELGWSLFFVLLALVIGFQAGHRYANVENAEECRRLGGFFVGRAVFKCHEVIEPSFKSIPPNPHQASPDHGQR